MKRRQSLATLLAWGIVATLFSACVLAARGDDKLAVKDKPAATEKPAAKPINVTAELEKAKDKVAPTYRLAYQHKSGDVVRTRVVHLATVETKIRGVAQTTKSRTVSTRLWKVRDIDAQGNITFDHSVEHVEMWNSVEGRQEVHFDSATDKTPPAEFATVASSVGKVLATIKIDPHGRILERNNALAQFNPGIGEVTIPFPNVPVKAGNSWSIPDELKLPLEDGTIKKIQTRQQYKLEKVEAGVATINIQTQVLTPINDAKLQSQLVQRLQRGTLKFDVDAGRLIHKQMDIDEEVFGFSGNDSHMQYLARFTEEPVKDTDQAAKSPAADAAKR